MKRGMAEAKEVLIDAMIEGGNLPTWGDVVTVLASDGATERFIETARERIDEHYRGVDGDPGDEELTTLVRDTLQRIFIESGRGPFDPVAYPLDPIDTINALLAAEELKRRVVKRVLTFAQRRDGESA